ncbi:MAG TPA: hypothetical protein ENF95_00185 [Candidatus Aenigmarchaeota archaeon]|nr:hypothetical protein [Candidatus Aenigmarchaeota archaeon]
MLKFLKPWARVSSISMDPKNLDWKVSEETVYSTMISHDKEGRSPKKIWEDKRKKLSAGELEKTEKDFLDKLASWGHISAFYQANVGINYGGIPRYTTLFLCSFDFSKYLQQSQRYTEAKYFVEPREELRELIPKQYSFYKDMIKDGVKKEDARYALPLSIAASHLHQNTNFAGMANIYRVLDSEYSRIPKLTKRVIDDAFRDLEREDHVLFRKELIDKLNSKGKGYPVANMFSASNKWVNELEVEGVEKFERKIDEELLEEAKKFNDHALTFLNLTNRRDVVDGYIAEMSLSAWHQFMRNDTVKQSVESIYDAARRGECVVPKTVVGTKYEEEFVELHNEALDFYNKVKGKFGEEECVGVLPHSLTIKVAFDFDGYNALHGFMKDRISKAAQWEIRDVAYKVKELIKRENPLYAEFIS